MPEKFSNNPFAEPLKDFKFEKNKNEKKVCIEKNIEPKIIEIAGRRIMDIDNEEGTLIKQGSLVFIDLRNAGFMKEFENVDGVTSHSYMGCAEIVGELSNGERIYLHARGPHSLSKFMEKIVSLIDDNELKIVEIEIRGEFGRNASIDESAAKRSILEMDQYKSVCKKYGMEEGTINISEESITGFDSEKVVGYSWTEIRK